MGEYYKLLLEGRRPMRTRNPASSEQQKSSNQANQAPQQQLIQRPRRQESQPERGQKPAEKSAQNERHVHGRSLRNQISTSLNKKRDDKEKEKHKLKDKRFKEQIKTRKQHMTSQNTISVMKHNIIKVQDDNGGIGSDVLKLQQQTQNMLKEKKKFKSLERELEMKEESKKEEDEKLKDDKRVIEKFESIDPHPVYAVGRFVVQTQNKFTVHQIIEYNQEQDKFILDSEDPENSQKSPNQVLFLSKVFLAKVSSIENLSEKITELLNKGANQENYILIQQILKQNRQENQLDFVSLVPTAKKEKFEAIEIKLKDQVNFQKDLREFENDIPTNQFKLAYQRDQTQTIVEISKNLKESFSDYLEGVRAIQINRDNMRQMALSIVAYDQHNNENKSHHRQKLGILLRIKYDPHFQDYMILLRLLNHKNTQKERTDWFQLSKYSFKADLTRGYVSMDYLKNLENVNNAGQKLKLRMFQMVSYRESQLQKQALRDISDIQDHSEPPRKATILKDSSHERCSSCNYITDEIDHLKCFNCQKNYHFQCLNNPVVHSLLGIRENEWKCQECIRCANCLSMRNRDQMLVCQKCNTGYHFDCLDQSVKLGVPSISLVEKDLKTGVESKKSTFAQLNQHYKCEQCVECEQCGSKEAGEKRINKWSKDYKLCSSCNKKRQNKQYCLVCERFWPDNTQQIQQQNQGEEQENVNQTIQCIKCEMQVHLHCDRIFQLLDAKQKFNDSILQYNCQKCRQNIRTQLITQVIDALAIEDKSSFFQEPVEEYVQNYTKIIKTPMCFKYVKQRIQTYLRNPEQLKSDVNLIFQNAITYNLPKQRVHKEALKLKEICNNLLSKYWIKIEKSKLRTIDEDAFQQRIKDQIQAEKQGQAFKQIPDEMLFMLPLEESLETIEHMALKSNVYGSPTREQFGSANAALVNSQVKEEMDVEGSDFDDNVQKVQKENRNQQDLVGEESEDQNISQSIGDSHSVAGFRDPQMGGITKNLRVRKQINYNEDRLLAAGIGANLLSNPNNDLTLSGSKRTHGNAFKSQNVQEQEDQDSPFTVNGNSIKNLKKQRQNQFKLDPDFIPSNYQPRPLNTATLLQQALNSDQRLLLDVEAGKPDQTKEVTQINHVQQQQQMMMSYYQEIDDEKCYYSNPARCSFDDPSLLFEEMCYLCGSFGNRQDFLSCTLCGESFHTYCLQLPDDQVAKFQNYWKCLNCKFCEICASATQEAFLLYCDVCDKAFHSHCLRPQLKSIPNCQWKCQQCFKCQQCGTKDFFSEKDTEEKKNLDVTDFEFSQNFSFCYQCGKNEYKKSFCKICQKKTDDSDTESKQETSRKKSSIHHQSLSLPLKLKNSKVKNDKDQMMKCVQCGFYSHFRCSRLLPQFGNNSINDQDYELETDQEILKDYKCLECLLAGKTINHLIRETCEQYENIHQIISRQKLLAQLCQEILNKYFPLQDKAPLFIKSFIDQNQEFFRKDELVNQWLNLLETNVCFEQIEPEINQQDPNVDLQPNDQVKQSDEEQENNEVDLDKEKNQEMEDLDIDGKQLLDEGLKDDFVEDKTEKFENQEGKNPVLRQKSEVISKKWNDINLSDALKKFEKNQPKDKVLTQSQKIYHQMYGHKETFLPEKRNLYQSLSLGNLHRFGQREHFIKPDELKNLISIPNDENLNKVNFAEEYVQIEFKAIMRVKMHFFRWFEDLIKSILKNNMKFMRKKKKQELQFRQSEDQSEEIITTSHHNHHHNHAQQSEQALEILRSSSLNNQLSEDDMCTQEDSIIQNPQIKLQCVLCRLFGELNVTGRLIPFQVNQFVHVNCALWSTDVYEIGDGQLVNFFFVQNGKARLTRCILCGESGATIVCFTRKCNAAFHFPCAYRENKVSFMRTKETYCDICSKQRDFKIGYLSEFSTKRRFQIARNQIPWNMSIMFQPQPGQNQNNPFAANTQLIALQQTQMHLNNISNPADLEKPLQIEKWRPFFYDMFNRVGNLTVLSLKKEINQIIEDTIYGSKREVNIDLLTDFAAIRVYWKFYQDFQMNEQEDESVPPINMRKSYFMYCNNTIREVMKNDLQSLVQFASEKIRERILFGIQQQQINNMQIDYDTESSFIPINQTGKYFIANFMIVFWQKIMQHFQRERPNFTLQNIIFSISEFGGKTKYPISVWNRAEVKNKSFFLKSGFQVLQIQTQNVDRESQSNQQATKRTEGKTIDDVFKRMVKINQMGENQNPMTSMKRLTCSKNMKYETMLNTLGKKMFYTKSHQEEMNQNNNQKTALAKKIRLTDTIDTNKEIDLPIAMKYRLSKAQPKRVEVGPSKIHRNGLFTLEEQQIFHQFYSLMPGDIVIEYVGEKIRNKVADKREIYYEQKGIGDCYLFRLDKEYIIDATFFGNKARYLNHSCDANCSAKIINVQQQKHIIISTNRQIKSGEELTYNYNFDYEADKLECFCGAPTCQGRLN